MVIPNSVFYLGVEKDIVAAIFNIKVIPEVIAVPSGKICNAEYMPNIRDRCFVFDFIFIW
ncbi:hypothetical protein VB735_13720 [Halotia wernerae UHCC 0503]|nr:hypothetical protein [Halotia wernerae UHCC 0503]